MKESDDKQKKKIIESKIVDWITKEAEGQVTVFKPKDIKGVDLVVKKRGEYPARELYLQIKGQDTLEENQMFIKDIKERDFEPSQNLYLIFAYFDMVEQDITEYVWLIPSLEFRDLAEEKTSEDGEPVLRFEAPLNPQKKNKYTPFLINKKDLAKVLLRIIASERFQWPGAGIPTIRIINLKELKKFITEARRNTYAGEGIPVDNPRLIGSVQLEYQKGDYFYRDIYFGGEENFIGQEVVYQNNVPVWSMVYCGSSISKEIEFFLKKSLWTLSESSRFGDKCELEEDDFRYQDEGKGSLERFAGEEKIFIKEKEVYKLNYQGGLISK